MIKILPPLCLSITAAMLLSACKPGPLTLGNSQQPMAIKDAKGNVSYVSYKVDKKQQVQVPVGLKGSDLTTAKIQAAYAQNALLNPYKIDVVTHRGMVTLSGTVPNKETKNYAIKIARYTKGVLAVDAKNLLVSAK